jgi:hypothetical protein
VAMDSADRQDRPRHRWLRAHHQVRGHVKL